MTLDFGFTPRGQGSLLFLSEISSRALRELSGLFCLPAFFTGQASCVMTRCADTGRVPPATGVTVGAAALLAGLRTVITLVIAASLIVAAALILALLIAAVAITIVSHIRILSAHIVISFAELVKSPLSVCVTFCRTDTVCVLCPFRYFGDLPSPLDIRQKTEYNII